MTAVSPPAAGEVRDRLDLETPAAGAAPRAWWSFPFTTWAAVGIVLVWFAVMLARFIGEAPDLDSLIGFRGSLAALPGRLPGGSSRASTARASTRRSWTSSTSPRSRCSGKDPSSIQLVVDPALRAVRGRRRAGARAVPERRPARPRGGRDHDLPGAGAHALQRLARGADDDHRPRRAGARAQAAAASARGRWRSASSSRCCR